MRILGLKPGHDGGAALIDDDVLVFSLEGEKGSFPRHSPLTVDSLLRVATSCQEIPDCIAVGGWPKGFYSDDLPFGLGYWGVDKERTTSVRLFGREVLLFETTHESTHVWGSVGMAPFADRFPCHVLVWEGNIGRFYRVEKGGNVLAYPQILDDPGNKYSFIFSLADPSYDDRSLEFRFQDAGKLMALAAYGDAGVASPEEQKVIDWVLDHPRIAGSRAKAELRDSPFYDIGVQSRKFKNLAARHSQAIFDRFHAWASENLEPGLPLAIGGGCGLNCTWNSAWVRSGLFSEVFVPPCVNDSGSALGAAIQAKARLTGESRTRWSVYSGAPVEDFDWSGSGEHRIKRSPLKVAEVASDLCAGHVVAILRGRCEIGPRALGHRSLLADPRDGEMLNRLNRIKKREGYRPIAPVCLAEAADDFFDLPLRDKFMLFFGRVKDPRLVAVTHVDGSARVQSVERSDDEFLWSLLGEFGERSGVPVLCNTSLNFPGKGFVNDPGELLSYCATNGVTRAIVGDEYLRLIEE